MFDPNETWPLQVDRRWMNTSQFVKTFFSTNQHSYKYPTSFILFVMTLINVKLQKCDWQNLHLCLSLHKRLSRNYNHYQVKHYWPLDNTGRKLNVNTTNRQHRTPRTDCNTERVLVSDCHGSTAGSGPHAENTVSRVPTGGVQALVSMLEHQVWGERKLLPDVPNSKSTPFIQMWQPSGIDVTICFTVLIMKTSSSYFYFVVLQTRLHLRLYNNSTVHLASLPLERVSYQSAFSHCPRTMQHRIIARLYICTRPHDITSERTEILKHCMITKLKFVGFYYFKSIFFSCMTTHCSWERQLQHR